MFRSTSLLKHRTALLFFVATLAGCAATPPTEAPVVAKELTPGGFYQDRSALPSNNPVDAAAAAPIDDLPAADTVPGEPPADIETSALFGEAQEPVYSDEQPTVDDDVAATPEAAVDEENGNDAPFWQRMRVGMSLPDKNHRNVAPHIDWYARHPAYVERTFDRARPFIHYILNETTKRGMPAEIALLPVVESAFQPFAYSHARASGIWQFIPDTGRRYGLKINWWYDGRRDVINATNAALNYLQDLHEQFDDDWLLALAAYNSGEGNVARAIERNLKRKRPTDFWSLELPRETRGYVPRLLAIAALVQHPQQFGATLRPIPDEPYFTPVHVDNQIDMALASELAGISIEDLYHLNPGHNRWATDPEGPHQLLLPLDRATDFSLNLASIPQNDRVKWQQHNIKRGETLKQIARTYQTTPEVLREINSIGGQPLRAGQSLLIPVTQNATSPFVPPGIRQDSQRVARGSAGKSMTHTVRSGDTLWSIGRRYDVSHLKIAEWNNMTPGSKLAVGKKLKVRNPKANEFDAADSAPATGPSTQDLVRYIVRKGDTLTQIARRFNVSVRSVLTWNTQLLGNSSLLRPGQTLTLFVNGSNGRSKG